jgi:sigma-B regulation protein RsbU (phosphoserine phosphatase)
MGLIVAAPEGELAAGVMARIREIEAGAIACPDLAGVLDSCAGPGGPDCVVCADLAWARCIADASPRVPVVLAIDSTPEVDLVLGALRAGLSDVWPLSMTTGVMADRLRAIRARAAAAAANVPPEDDAEREFGLYGAELERDMRAGRFVQTGMLPPTPAEIGGYRFEYRIVPSMFMSGDFVDYFPLTERYFLFYLADVSGHGAASAFVTVLLKSFSNRLRREHRPEMLADPGRILEWVNTELLEQKIDKHVAVILGLGDLTTHEIALVNGGHYPPAIRVSSEGPELLQQKGRPVGLFANVSYTARRVQMQPGDRLVHFSDGVLDAMGPASLADKEARLLLATAAGVDVADIWAHLGADAAPAGAPDDRTCLVVRRER